MKKSVKILLIIVVLAVLGGWIYWQLNKKGLIRNSIENAVSKGTDNLYYIHYDSSYIDEVNGNAIFYNVDLQSDSLQKQLAQFDTASASTVYNVHIDKVSVIGANIPALISNTKVEASSIEITHPIIYIISAGRKEKRSQAPYDTLALYEKILGKYKSISADEIRITNGNIFFSDKSGVPHTSLNDVSVQLKNFRVDSTKDYNNIASYFIKDVIATVKEFSLKATNKSLSFTDIEYNAPGKFIKLKRFLELDSLQQTVFDINNTSINNINTDSFILRQQIKADEFKTDGGLIKLYRKQHDNNSGSDQITFDNGSFDEIFIKAIDIGSTKLVVYSKTNSGKDSFVLDNMRFSASGIQRLYSGINIVDLIGNSKSKLSADGFSFLSADKIYKFNVGAFQLQSNTDSSSMHVNEFSVVPQVTEAAFVKSQKYQHDLYNFVFKNIELQGIDIPALIADKKLLAAVASLQPTLKIFNDRLITPNPAVKKYPNQQLMELKQQINLKKVFIKNGLVEYTERGALSKQKGTVFFRNLNGIISNVTNIKEAIAQNNILLVEANGLFMGISKMQTTWKLPLSNPNGIFTVSGTATGFDVTKLNAMSEPLGMASFKKGKINKLNFNFTGDNLASKGSLLLLYDDLKVEMLKKDSNELKKKDLTSFLTNLLVKNSNPKNGSTKEGKISFQRDMTKSFFNLLWKSIFDGAKNTAQKL